MAPSPPTLGIPPPAPERLGRELGSAATHASAEVTAAVSPSRDVIFEILSWLPAKSLGRCRCVSKEWRTLISDRAFVVAHNSRAEPLLVAMSGSSMWNHHALLLLDTDGTVVRVVKDQGETQSLGAHWTLRASHDGLACISSGYDDSGTLVVDLATGKTLLACFKPVEETTSTGNLCFGFGRAAVSGSIKVLRLVVHTRTCEVLTLGEGARWRQAKPPPTMLSHTTSGVAVNGALHFLSEDKCDVLSFDLEDEDWKLIHGPQGGMEVITIADLNGALCMAQRMHRVINIWLLTSDSGKNIWTKAYTMPAPLFGFEKPLRLLRPGRELLFCGYGYTANLVLQVYHPRLGRCTQVKTPAANLSGKIELCSSTLDPRFCGQSDPS